MLLVARALRPVRRAVAARARSPRAAPDEPPPRRLWAATEVLRFARSPFACWLDAAVATAPPERKKALVALRDPVDPFSQLLAAKGDAWERDVRDALASTRSVVDLSTPNVRRDPSAAAAKTADALRAGADVIYQAPAVGGSFLGVPDLLVRDGDAPSAERRTRPVGGLRPSRG